MFAFTTNVSNGADAARTGRALLQNLLGKRSARGTPMTDTAGELVGRVEATVPNLPAATGYMAWRS